MARTVRTKVYKFEELNKKAKQKAIEWYRSNNHEIHWADENRHSMEKFAEIFPIKVTNWSYGGRGEGVSFHFTCEDAIEELSGQRLATYLWNNYRSEIYSSTYVKSWFSDKPAKHPRVKFHLVTEKHRGIPEQLGRYSNTYYKNDTVTYYCPLTGYFMDNEILDKMWKFIDKPDGRTFKYLLEDCFSAWIEACNKDIEWQNSDEYISGEIEANDYEFTVDGNKFNY